MRGANDGCWWVDPIPVWQPWRHPFLLLASVVLLAALLLGSWSAFAQQVTPDAVVGGMYNATPPTYSDKQRSIFQTDANGNLRTLPSPSGTAGSALTPVTSSALAANQVVCSAACNLYSFEVSADSTLSAAPWWIMIHNATAAPNDGAVTPTKCYAMASGTTSYAAAFPMPIRFSTGVVIGVSTNGCFTKAASTHAFISGDAQ